VLAPTTPMQLNFKKLSLLFTLLLFSLLSIAEVVDAELKQAVEQLKIQAEQGDAESQHLLGITYIKGFGVTKSSSEAVKWFRKSAENGNVNAQYNLGVAYYHGRGIKLDKKKAMKWYKNLLSKIISRSGIKSAEQDYLQHKEAWPKLTY